MTPAEDRYALTETQTLALHEQGFVGPLTLWESSETDAIRSMLERLYIDDPDPAVGVNIRHVRHREIVDLLRKHGGKTRAELWKAAGNQTNPLHYLSAFGLLFGGNS